LDLPKTLAIDYSVDDENRHKVRHQKKYATMEFAAQLSPKKRAIQEGATQYRHK
jgi:hypothetical protein